MTDFERWTVLRDAIRVRITQAEIKEDAVKDPASKMAVRYHIMAYKDVIRLMSMLELKL